MQLTRFAVVAAVGIGLAVPIAAAAQEESGVQPAPRDSRAGAPVAAPQAYALPGSFERIKRRMAASRESRDGRPVLNLNYYVDVYARAPALEILQDFDLDSETVSYGSPTHLEMLEAATPREWRPRAISTGNVFGWR
jgi:hypothetical protein